MFSYTTTVAAALGAAAATLAFAAPALADPSDPAPAPPVTDPATPTQVAVPEQGVPHLSALNNLPPGTTMTPPDTGGRMGYLRDLWHAVQTQEVSGKGALLLLTQRPIDDSPSPYDQPATQQPAPAPAP